MVEDRPNPADGNRPEPAASREIDRKAGLRISGINNLARTEVSDR